MTLQVTEGVSVETPALDACARERDAGRLEVLGEFIDWLSDAKHLVLARHGRRSTTFVACPDCARGKDWSTATPRIAQLVRVGALSELALPDCASCNGSGRVMSEVLHEDELEYVAWTPTAMIGEFLGIDPDAMEDEKMALLAAIRGDEPPSGWVDENGVWKRS